MVWYIFFYTCRFTVSAIDWMRTPLAMVWIMFWFLWSMTISIDFTTIWKNLLYWTHQFASNFLYRCICFPPDAKYTIRITSCWLLTKSTNRFTFFQISLLNIVVINTVISLKSCCQPRGDSDQSDQIRSDQKPFFTIDYRNDR